MQFFGKLSTIIVITVQYLLLTSLYCGKVDSLIGLRPPSATYKPNPVDPRKESNPVVHDRTSSHDYSKKDNIQLFIVQRSRPHSPVRQEVLNKVISIQQQTDNDINVKGNNGNCKPSAVVKCSIRFLKDYLRNNTTLCYHVKELESCILDQIDNCNPLATRQTYRILDEVKSLVLRSGPHACGAHMAVKTDTQENRAEQINYSPCCVVNLLECMTRTYRMLLKNRKSCEAITDFTSCSSFSFKSYDSKTAEKIFHLIMTLTRTCINSRNPYET